MNQDRWLDTMAMIKDKFELEEDSKIVLDPGPGEMQTVVFKTDHGRFKLERIVRPRVLDKKTSYTHRGGGETTVDFVYSADETVAKLAAYRWDESKNDWSEIAPEAFSQ